MIIEVTQSGVPIMLNRNIITAIRESREHKAIISVNIEHGQATVFEVDQSYHEIKKQLLPSAVK